MSFYHLIGNIFKLRAPHVQQLQAVSQKPADGIVIITSSTGFPVTQINMVKCLKIAENVYGTTKSKGTHNTHYLKEYIIVNLIVKSETHNRLTQFASNYSPL